MCQYKKVEGGIRRPRHSSTAEQQAAAMEAFQFKDLRPNFRYYDAKKLDEIEKLERDKEWEKAYPLLKEYVQNFGMNNFLQDMYLVWRLGRMSEQAKDIGQAKFLYRLVLKHHRGDIKVLEQHYDSLTSTEKDYYVPLEYYYELVEFRKSVDTLLPPVGVLIDMGIEINSPKADYGPTLSPDNKFIFFTSKRNTKKMGIRNVTVQNEDIYYARNVDGYWEPAQPLDNINTSYNEGSAVLTRNGRKLYFCRCEAPGGLGDCDIYMAELQPDSTWGKIQNLGPRVNSRSWDSQPSLSRSEDTLYFASDRLGGFGGSDLYFTYRSKGGAWAPAQNMGPTINTRRNEVSPFYHPNHNVLYFSSEGGHIPNFGSFDIYKTYYSRGMWQEPVNVGPLVNGKGSEYYFTIDMESKNLYYARSEETDIQNLDLNSFPLPMEAQPKAIVHLQGAVIDSISKNPFTGIVSVIDLTKSIEVAPKYLRPDGSYDFDLIQDHEYLVIVTGDDFFRVERQFKLVGDTSIYIETPAISLKKWAFASLEFEAGSAKIIPEMYNDLNKLVKFMADHPNFSLRISGHTDSQGKQSDNLKLSQRRADSIKKYIVDKGKIDPGRIEAIGYGSSQPLIEEKTEDDRSINRRVEFEINKMKPKTDQMGNRKRD
ncbi:OmpA family protein [Cytophagaceae bacterium DM2B3-1]|uniref:OmpA family protein n=1 Tax=Xanthocytophaga flava TaxID=3048013 RepID=A0ABT7CPC7_9BACT|nr:OmpA family protein [Xanthocytophaga flavus]MDJ1495599.1 OmpA family protein [Xanthocytophaga flavus]